MKNPRIKYIPSSIFAADPVPTEPEIIEVAKEVFALIEDNA